MTYRDLLYDTYVSANKKFRRPLGSRTRPGAEAQAWRFRKWLTNNTLSVLDLGCGSGEFLEVLASMGFLSLTGVDSSKEQLIAAGQTRRLIVEADIAAFLEQSAVNAVDVILLLDVLEHFTRDEAIFILRSANRHLRPGGHLILQLPNGDSPFSAAVFASDLTHETLYTSISLRHVLEACGFTQCEFLEVGPVPLSLIGAVRCVLWQVFRTLVRAVHLIETGEKSTNVYTRVLACRAMNARITSVVEDEFTIEPLKQGSTYLPEC